MSSFDPQGDKGREENGEGIQPLREDPVAPMRLRPEAPRVTRLSRKVLAGIGLVAGVGLGGSLICALQTRNGGKPSEELYATDHHTTADGLASLPRDYTGIPRLGPPLPGDLGRPILNAQTHGQSIPPVGITVPDPGLSAEEQRRLQELEAARTSRLFSTTATRPPEASAAAAANAAPVPDLTNLGFMPQPATPSAQDRQLAFLNAGADRRTMASDRLTPPASANILQAGFVIPAALITGIRSDLPGQITAQVTENVHDSPTGRILLIPQGTRVVGQYDNGVGASASAVSSWSGTASSCRMAARSCWSDSRAPMRKDMPGSRMGSIIIGDLCKAAALTTLLSIGSEAGYSGNESDIARALRQGTSNSASQIGQQIIGRQLAIAPTLTIRPGFPVRIIVTRDLVLEPYGG